MVPLGKKPAPGDHESSLKISLARCPCALINIINDEMVIDFNNTFEKISNIFKIRNVVFCFYHVYFFISKYALKIFVPKTVIYVNKEKIWL